MTDRILHIANNVELGNLLLSCKVYMQGRNVDSRWPGIDFSKTDAGRLGENVIQSFSRMENISVLTQISRNFD